MFFIRFSEVPLRLCCPDTGVVPWTVLMQFPFSYVKPPCLHPSSCSRRMSAEQRQPHAQLSKCCGDPTFLQRVEAFHTDIRSGYFIGCNLEQKSKPITRMRRNELVDVRGWRGVGEEEGGGGMEVEGAGVSVCCDWHIPQASALIGPRLGEAHGFIPSLSASPFL